MGGGFAAVVSKAPERFQFHYLSEASFEIKLRKGVFSYKQTTPRSSFTKGVVQAVRGAWGNINCWIRALCWSRHLISDAPDVLGLNCQLSGKSVKMNVRQIKIRVVKITCRKRK